MKKYSTSFILLALGFLILSCAKNNSTQTQEELNAIRTQAVSTYASSLTETLVALQNSSPTVTSLPSFTPEAFTETPAVTNPPQNTCYNLIFIQDVTIPDGTLLKANETFTKTWLVQNNGGCAWAPGFSFNHVGGDLMRGKTLVLTDPIPVGAKRELSLQLTVPSGVEGLIQSSWQMADANGVFFGDTLTVNIMVGTITTPAFTATP
jgi:hypothetical protein